jgi:TatD DNase family protein
MIDSHVHLDADQYADPGGPIKQALEAQVVAMVAPGTGPGSNRRVLELALRNPQVVHAAIGFHPEHYELTENDADEVLETIERERKSICAVGEVGLPWYGERARDSAVVRRARRTLARFAAAATTHDLPLILHAPHRSAAEALEIVRAARVRRAVFHWHKSDEATTRAIVAAGYFISLTPEVVYRERDQELARMLPLEKMLVETDGPWPYGGPFAGRLTTPAMIKDVVAAIAHLKCATFEEIATATTANARWLFGIGQDIS